MLAARDQENLAYAHQQAAASKPLNQAPKTPGPNGARGGRKPIRDDENNPFVVTGKKTALGKDKATFVTPAPRERAPLGAKTTNAKAKPLQTPAPLTTARQGGLKTHQRSASARKPKLKIHHQPEEVTTADPISKQADSDNDSLPEVEYCPPKIKELPDYPDPDDPYEIKPGERFPQLAPENLFRGVWDTFQPRGEDGLTAAQRRAKKADEETERYIAEQDRKSRVFPKLDIERELEEEDAAAGVRAVSRSSKRDQTQGTITSRSAAAALADSSSRPKARFAQPTASTQAKTSAPPKNEASRLRMTPGTAASMNTIGYSKGRKVSSNLKAAKPDTDSTKPQNSRSRADQLLDELYNEYQAEESGGREAANDGIGISFDPLTEDELKDFQLEIPE